MTSPLRRQPSSLSITGETRGPDLVVVLDGVLSAGDAVSAQVGLLDLSATCSGRIVLDCARLTYVASAGLRALLALRRNASGRSSGVWLAGVTDPVRQILDVAGLLAHFNLAPSVAAALERTSV